MYTDKMSPLGMPLRTVFIASIDIVGRGSGMPSARHRGVSSLLMTSPNRPGSH